jgi:hypothetical protein
MLLPSEIEAKSLIPAVRAILAKNIRSRKRMLQRFWVLHRLQSATT